MKIGAKIVVLTLAVVLVVFGVTVYISISQASAISMADAKAIANSTAAYLAKTVESELTLPLDEVRALGSVFQTAVGVPSIELTRDKANTLLKDFLEKNPNFLDDYVAFEPNAFDGADAKFRNKPGHDDSGRFVPIWSLDGQGKGVLEALTDYDKKGPGDYYQVPKERVRESVIDPYSYALNGKNILMASLVVPVKDTAGKFIGIAGIDVDLQALQAKMQAVKIGSYVNAYAFVYSENGTVAAAVDASYLGKKVEEVSNDAGFIAAVHKGEIFSMERPTTVYKGAMVLSVGYPATVGKTGQQWMVNVNIRMDEVAATARQLTLLLIGIAAAAVALIIVMLLLISRSISLPLGVAVGFAKKIADGDLTAILDTGKRRDEIGQLSSALNAMRGNLREMAGQIQDGASQLASGTEELSASAQHLAEGAQSQASTLEETSASIEELSSSVHEVSTHAQSQSTTVTGTASSTEQVLKSAHEVSGTLGKVAQSAGESVERARQGAASVKDAITAIKEIAEGSEKIAGIVSVISDIADQTNLLSLNASIEAARAGEHGRGFAVVADEVSKLAERSAQSTKEIEALIKGTLKQVKEGVDLAERSGLSMDEIISGAMSASAMVDDLQKAIEQQVGGITEIAKAVENIRATSQGITAATEEQSTNAAQVSKAIETVNEITQSAASSAEQMASSVEEMAGMAQELHRLVGRFTLEKDDSVSQNGAGRQLQPGPVAGAV
jgi:methyl-accepting chemotaxis protein